MKILFFGWDGVPLKVVKTAIETGYTPNLRDVINMGGMDGLLAEPPIVTPANWYAALTGYRPTRHGLINFVVIDTEYNLRYMSIRDLRVEGVWDMLGRNGHRGLYMNIPISTPAPKVEGVWIAQEQEFVGPSKPRPENVYPVEILEVLNEMGYRIGYPFYSGSPEDYYKRVMEVEEERLRAMYELMRRGDYTLHLYIAMTPDILLHMFMDDPSYMEYVYKCLSRLDEWLGRYMDHLGDEASYIIMSDHGHRRKDKLIDLITILADLGYLQTRRTRRIRATWLRRNSLVRRIWRALPQSVKKRLNVGINRVFILESPAREMQTMVDWERTEIFPLVNVGGLKANLKGLFRKGSVEASEHEKLVDEVVEKLGSLEIDGIKIFKEVLSNPNPEPDIPDILLEPDDRLWFASRGTGKKLFKPSQPSLSQVDDLRAIRIAPSFHIREGFYAFGGKGFRKGLGGKLSIMDIAPLILYLANTPIPEDIDGRLPTNHIDSELLRNRKPRYSSGKARLREKLIATRRKLQKNKQRKIKKHP